MRAVSCGLGGGELRLGARRFQALAEAVRAAATESSWAASLLDLLASIVIRR